MGKFIGALMAAAVAGLMFAAAVPAAAPVCLHGSGERPAQRARRMAALEFAKQLNVRESEGKLQALSFYTIDDLPLLPKLPDGFAARMSTDGLSYAFSLKDTQDPCGFAYFSDQDGKIYAGTPVH